MESRRTEIVRVELLKDNESLKTTLGVKSESDVILLYYNTKKINMIIIIQMLKPLISIGMMRKENYWIYIVFVSRDLIMFGVN